MDDKTTCEITAVIKATRMRRKDILAHIEAGKIKAQKQYRAFVFEIEEITRLKSLHDKYTGFFRIAQGFEKSGEFSFERRRCRDELIEFATENSWFGADVMVKEHVFFAGIGNEAFFVRKTDEPKIAPHIRLSYTDDRSIESEKDV
jgi:hypothetical protein